MARQFYRKQDRRTIMVLLPLAVGLVCLAAYQWANPSAYESLIRSGGRGYLAQKVRPYHIREDGDRRFLWASGSRDPSDPDSDWFEMTGSPLPLASFEHGIGRDAIPAIDKPVFVKPDDARLIAFWSGRGVNKIDDLEVLGFEHNGDARAYPRRLLRGRELVNDTVGGKPVTVGW